MQLLLNISGAFLSVFFISYITGPAWRWRLAYAMAASCGLASAIYTGTTGANLGRAQLGY
jgi:hypothetical protein